MSGKGSMEMQTEARALYTGVFLWHVTVKRSFRR